MKLTISLIIPALNEEAGLEPTVNKVIQALGEKFIDYEILIVNDGSQDKTGEIAERLAANNYHIRVFHNPKNLGLGYNYRRGVGLATKDYIGWVPGDNDTTLASLENIFGAVGQEDIVVVYIKSDIRGWIRQSVSKSFCTLLNLLFGLKLKYFNGPCVHKREILQRTKMTTNGFAFMAETLIRLIKAGHGYTEVGLDGQMRQGGKSKAFLFKNWIRVLTVIFRLFMEIQIVGTLKGGYKLASPVERSLSIEDNSSKES